MVEMLEVMRYKIGTGHQYFKGVWLQVFRVLVGEGDQYSGWLDLDENLIKWWHVPRNQTFFLNESSEILTYLTNSLRVS